MKRIFVFLLSFMLLAVNVSAENVVWFDNLNNYIVGNYNQISEFENGYAEVVCGQMNDDWSLSNETHLIIDKTGRVVLGPFYGDYNISLLKDNKFYIYSYDSKSTIIADIYGNTVASFSGLVGEFNKNGIALWLTSHYDGNVGLIKSDGTVVVPCKYKYRINSNSDEYFLLTNSLEGKNAVVYKADGTYSHDVYSNYTMAAQKNNLIEIATQTGERGLMDIYGNIIVQPMYPMIKFLSKDRIFLTGSSLSCLIDNEVNVINTYKSNSLATEMYNNKFVLKESDNAYLVTENGEIIKSFENIYSVSYCGEGVISLEYRYPDYKRLVNVDTGEFIGEKYDDSDVVFNEGYAVVTDLEDNRFLIDKEGNKYFEEYSPKRNVSDGVSIVVDENKKICGIIHVPKYKATRLVIKGNEIKLVSKIQKSNDRTFYPLRECLENIGATVSWDSKKQIATGEYNGIKIEFPIGENGYYINGVKHEMDVKSYIDGSTGRTYIPIRYAAEGLGFTVEWTEGDSENTISIH